MAEFEVEYVFRSKSKINAETSKEALYEAEEAVTDLGGQADTVVIIVNGQPTEEKAVDSIVRKVRRRHF
jgi:hypothetical protein